MTETKKDLLNILTEKQIQKLFDIDRKVIIEISEILTPEETMELDNIIHKATETTLANLNDISSKQKHALFDAFNTEEICILLDSLTAQERHMFLCMIPPKVRRAYFDALTEEEIEEIFNYIIKE